MQKAKKLKAFITGADGFIGKNLVASLIKDNWQLKVLTRRDAGRSRLKNIELICGDITSEDVVLEGVRGVDVVFNLAALLPHSKAKKEDYVAVNVTGVKNVLKACHKHKVGKLVHVSTVGIYGSSDSVVINENSPRKLSDDYSITKAEGEDLVFSYIKDFGLRATIIKPTIAYGPFDMRPGFSTLFKLINKGLFIPVGNGENYLHTVYVGNLVDALIISAINDKSIGEDFIIGDDPCPQIREIIEWICKAQNLTPPKFYLPKSLAYLVAKLFDVSGKFGLPAPLNSRRLAFITDNRRYNIDKAKRILGYKPKISVQEGARLAYDWYRVNGYI